MKKQPEIRLEGFEGDWEETALNNVAEINPPSVLPDTFQYVDLESVKGTELLGALETSKTAAPSRAQRLAAKGDIFYQTVRPYQRNNFLFDSDETDYVFSTGYAQLRPFGDEEFLFSLVRTDGFVREVLDNCTGTSYPAITATALSEIEFSFPDDPNEQRAIGEFFSNLDSTLTESTTKIEKLKNLRATMLVKMFPQGTSKVPEIRLDGFEGDWTFLTLGEEAEFLKGSGFAKKDLRNDGSPIVLYGRLYTQYETVIQDVDTFVDPSDQKCVTSRGGEVLVPASGETAEDIAVATVLAVPGVIIGSDLNIVRPFNKLESEFLALSISHGEVHKRLAMSAQGKTVVHLKNDDLRELSVPTPTPEEQRAIGTFFRELDELIDAEELKLTKLTNLKNTFLTKMFV